MKRLILTSLMAITLMSASAYDFSYTNTFLDEVFVQHENTLYYAVNEDGNTVSVVAGPEKYNFGLTVIPETVEHNGKTYTVTIIGNNAFSGGRLGSRLIMPNSITDIQSRAFSECSVDSVAFSTGLKTIGDKAFDRCPLTSVYLHEGVTNIGYGAFARSAGYGSGGVIRIAVLPESLTDLGEQAFSYQSNLTYVKLPSRLKEIKYGTFYFCSNLFTIELPEYLEKIGDAAFEGTALTAITFPDGLKEIGGGAFCQCHNLQSVILPNSVESIGSVSYTSGVFRLATNLKSVKLSSGMKIVPAGTFQDCGKLAEVIIPEGITTIEGYAFSNCMSLSSVVLPEGLTELGYSVFGGSGIQTIQLPSTLNYIGDGMFSGCKSLASFTIPSTIKEIKDGAFSGCENLTHVTIPESVQNMGNLVFCGCALTEVTIPASITILSNGTFEDCKKLKKVTLPEGLTVIGGACFRRCEVLTDINIPSTLTTTYNDVFQECFALKELTFPSSLESWGSGVFSECTSLTAVHIHRAIPPTGNNPYTKDLIDPNNQCILYVPTGSKATYQSEEAYRYFKEIREENVDATIYYQVTANVVAGNGRILVNGSYEYGSSYAVAKGSDVVLTFEPSDGWMLSGVKVNGVDRMAEVSNNELTIASIEANIIVEAAFKEKPVLLCLKTGNGGNIGMEVEKGSRYICHIQPEDGWRVNTVMLNGMDVTNDMNNNTLLTPELFADALIVVTFEMPNSIAYSAMAANGNMKAYTTLDGQLSIDGVPQGEKLLITTADGRVLMNSHADGQRITLPLSQHGVYVVSTRAKTIKVNY